MNRLKKFNNNNAYIAGQCKALLQLIYLRTIRSERDDTQQIPMADLSHHVKNSSNPNQYIVEETVETSFIINVDNIYEPKKILSEENTSTGTEYDLNVTSSIKHIFDTPEDPAILDKKENCHDYLSNNVKQNYTAVPPSEECYFPSVQVEANASRVFQEEHTENTINHNCGISAVGSKYNTFIKKPQDSDEIAQIVQDLVLQRFGQAYPHVTKPLMENGKHKVHECGNEEKSLNNNLKSKETNVIEKPKIIQSDLFYHENAAEKQENNDSIKALSESHTVFGNNKEFTYSMTDDESWSESSQGSSLYNLSTYSLDGSIVKRTKCSYTRTPNETYNFDEDSFNDSSFVYSNDLYHIVKENEHYEQCPSNNESEDEPQLKNSMCNLSVETDDISDLVSSNSLLNLTFTRHQKSTESINTIFSNNSQLSYVDVIVREERQNNNTNDYVANLQLQLSEQENIIKQSESVLKFGKGKKGFTGSVPYLEAERILLVSKIRKNALNTAIRKNHPNADSKEDNVLGNITVEHIGCDTNVLKEKIEPDLCYYVCILQNGTNVYSTKISAPDVYGEIDFGGKFVFNNVNSSFNIKLELYSLSIKKKTKLFQCVKIPVPRRHRKFPKFNLVVGREITILNLNEQIFPLKNEVIYADTSVSVSLPETTIKGYITIGKEINGHPVCDRRWCVLEGSDLKYYNYPTDEDYEEPIGVISLTNCVDCRPYIRPNTILLEIEKNKGKRVFYVTADNVISFRIWQRKLNLVLGVIKNWRL